MGYVQKAPATGRIRQAPSFICPACDTALSTADLAELGLRGPDLAETQEEYCDAELLDPRELRHLQCLGGSSEL